MGKPNDNRRTAAHSESIPKRRIIIAARWALAATGAVVILLSFNVFAPPARLGALAALSFLLANALWQHLALAPACLAAFAACALLSLVAASCSPFAGLPSCMDGLLAYLGFAALGAAVALLVLPRIDRAIAKKR